MLPRQFPSFESTSSLLPLQQSSSGVICFFFKDLLLQQSDKHCLLQSTRGVGAAQAVS